MRTTPAGAAADLTQMPVLAARESDYMVGIHLALDTWVSPRGILQQKWYLRATSQCCLKVLHASGGQWTCSKCRRSFFPTNLRGMPGTSAMELDQDSQAWVSTWVAGWTGIPEEELEISVVWE